LRRLTRHTQQNPQRLIDIVRRDGLDLRILAVGGVCSAERIKAFSEAGAYAILGASACAWDPWLAIRAKQLDPML